MKAGNEKGSRAQARDIGRLAVLAGSALLLAACASLVNSVIIDRDTGTRRWETHNVFLANDIRVLDIREEVKEGVLFVDILIRNGWAMPIGGKLKVQFYDKRGVALPDAWGWKQILLESRQEHWFRTMAPKPADEIGRIKIMSRGINVSRK